MSTRQGAAAGSDAPRMCSWASGCFPAPAQAFSIFNPGLVYAVCLSWLHIIITTAYVRLSLTASVRITVAVSISQHHQHSSSSMYVLSGGRGGEAAACGCAARARSAIWEFDCIYRLPDELPGAHTSATEPRERAGRAALPGRVRRVVGVAGVPPVARAGPGLVGTRALRAVKYSWDALMV